MVLRRRCWWQFVPLVAVGIAGCRGNAIPRPPLGPHRPGLEDVEQVDYPPPPAHVEEVDNQVRRDDDCVWVDGTWRWNGRRWAWEAGGWVQPPPGCYYAPAESFWQPSPNGPAILFHRNALWYPDFSATGSAASPCAPPKPCDE